MNRRQAKKLDHKKLLLRYVGAKLRYVSDKQLLNSIYGANAECYCRSTSKMYSIFIKHRADKRFINRIETLYPRETRKLKRKGYV